MIVIGNGDTLGSN